MKKLILGLSACVAIASSACLFTGCKNDKALGSVIETWNAIKSNDYMFETGDVKKDVISAKNSVKEYSTRFARRDNVITQPKHENFLDNAIAPLLGLNTISKATYKDKLSNSSLKNLNKELKELNTALKDYTNYITGMENTFNAGATLLDADYNQYESLASIVINEAIEASDVYLDMLYNEAINCVIASDATVVSAEVATTIKQKLNIECAKSLYSVYYKLTGLEKIALASKRNLYTNLINNYQANDVFGYSDNVTDKPTIEKLIKAQKQIAASENAAEIIDNIATNLDYAGFKLNFQTYYAKGSDYFDEVNQGSVYKQDECISKYSSKQDYDRYLNLSNLMTIDVSGSYSTLTDLL